MRQILPLLIIALLLCAVSCPKPKPAEPTATGTGSAAVPDPATANNPETGSGFIAEVPLKPLAQSPLNLGGVSLGVSPDLHGRRYEGANVELEQEWRDEGWTGIQWRTITDADSDAEESSYFNEGQLVGFQRIEPQDLAAFTVKTDVLTTKYGEWEGDLPGFLVDTVAFEDFTEGNPDILKFWIDQPTNTVIAGRYDDDTGSSVWMLFHPEQFVSVRGDVFAAMGS